MDLYILDSVFTKQHICDVYESFLWTERFSSCGDFVFQIEETQTNLERLKPGVFIGNSASNEVMRISTREIKNGLITVKGSSLVETLNSRIFRTSANHKDRNWAVPAGSGPRELIKLIVKEMCTVSSTYTPSSAGFDIDSSAFSNLVVSSAAADEVTLQDGITISFGTVYNAIKELAETYDVGISMVPQSDGTILFDAFYSKNKTSDQSLYGPVIFSPNSDTLENTSEIETLVNYKNVAYAFAPNAPDALSTTVCGVAYSNPGAESSDFDRFELLVMADDINEELVGSDAAKLKKILDVRAANALINNNFTKILDGDVVPQSPYSYGKHYEIGDIVELSSSSNFKQKARITEFIRVKDKTGYKEWPALSIVT